MRIQGPTITNLLKALPGRTTGESTDGIIGVPPLVMPSIALPLPIHRLYQVGVIGTDFQRVSLVGGDKRTMNTSSSSIIGTFDEGLWRIFLSHWADIIGAVSDVTADAEVNITVTGVGSSGILSTVRSIQSVFQHHTREFHILVQKEAPVTINHVWRGGAGTSFNNSMVSLIAQRLL